MVQLQQSFTNPVWSSAAGLSGERKLHLLILELTSSPESGYGIEHCGFPQPSKLLKRSLKTRSVK